MKKFTILFCSLLAAATMQAQILHVPADYPTIQQGINAANPGDTVLVAEGTYYEQINFMGKSPLMVTSQFLDDGNESHIAGTIIDGSNLTNMDSASVVYFISGEDTTSILCGFTIQNGHGTYTPENLNIRAGGGILISDAGAKIINNRITHNIVDDTQAVNGEGASGGGIATPWEESNHWVVIADNIIDSNTCISNSWEAYGGGIATAYNTRIDHNIVSYNTCSGLLDASAMSGGIDYGQDPAWTTPVVAIIQHNTITHNITQAQKTANSAGVWTSCIQVLFSHNEVTYNTVISGNNLGGSAGLLLYRPDAESVLSNNVFKGNVSNRWSGGLHLENDGIYDNTVLVENNYFIDNEAFNGGAFSSLSVPVTLQNNVFSGNDAGSSGGAVYLYDSYNQPIDHLAILANNTFSANSAGYGGAVFTNNANPLTFNNIFWQDSATMGKEIYKNTGYTLEIAFSNIDPAGVYGTYVDAGGNIFEDPMFDNDELLTLDPSSPCIESGTSDVWSQGVQYYAPEYDILGQLRPMDNEWDLGAYEQEQYDAHIIHVPADYPTIQQGIDAAHHGDTVLVAENTYYENINFNGKAILVASEFIMDGIADHIDNTIIDGSQAVNPDSASVVYFISGEDSTSVLCGFTIQGGRGTYWDVFESMGGAGIFITNSTATIRNNLIQNNLLDDTELSSSLGCVGGGIHSSFGTPGWTVIENNVITNNAIVSNHDWTEGGGIYTYVTHTRVINNKVTGNLSQNTGYGFGAAGGIICEGSPEEPVEAIIRGNLIENNEARAIEYGYGGGSGAWFLTDNSVIANNKFIHNKNDWNGGALDLFSTSLTAFKIENNYFIGNEALNGGAIDVDFDSTSQVLLFNNIFVQNKAYNQGGAIWLNRSNVCPLEHMLVSINNSFYGNHADATGGAIYVYEDNPMILNSILWQNPDLSGYEIAAESGYTEIAFSDINTDAISGENVPGPGLFYQDPLFSDTVNLFLQEWNSPCVDAGAGEYACSHGNTYFAPAYDILGVPRPSGSGYDMGAYDTAKYVGVDRIPSGSQQLAVDVYPNPFSTYTTFEYELGESGLVNLTIFDHQGKEITVLVNEEQSQGTHKVTWNVTGLPAGLYLYRLSAFGHQQSAMGRLVLVR